MVPLELVYVAGRNPVLNTLLIVVSAAGLVGLVLLLTLLMDKLDAEHGPWGFCGALVGVGLCGVIGGYVGWKLYAHSGGYFGSSAGIAVGIGIVYLVLKVLEHKAGLK